MTNEEKNIFEDKLIFVAAGTDDVYKSGLRGSTLNPVADEIIKLQRKYINESTNLLDLSLSLQETDEDGTGLRVTKRTIEIVPSSQEYMKIEHSTNATLRDFAPSLVLGKKYELVWKATGYVSYAYLSLLGYEPEDTAKESLVFVATEEILDGHIIAVAADIYDNGIYTEIVSSPATFTDIALYEVPEDVVADGLDERMEIIKEEVPAVYQAALNKGIEQGKQDEYDSFWDRVQNLGNRTNYRYGFAGEGWTNETFRPKYDIKPKNSLLRCFVNTNITGSITEILQRQGVVLDTSDAEDVQYMFDSSQHITEIPHIVCNKSAAGLFSWCSALVKASIEVNENTAFSSSLHRCDALEELTVLGTIGKNGFDAQYSTKLSRASIESIIAALSTTTTGLTVTFSKAAVDKAFETSEGANDGSTSWEWLDLVATRSNWNIALV